MMTYGSPGTWGAPELPSVAVSTVECATCRVGSTVLRSCGTQTFLCWAAVLYFPLPSSRHWQLLPLHAACACLPTTPRLPASASRHTHALNKTRHTPYPYPCAMLACNVLSQGAALALGQQLCLPVVAAAGLTQCRVVCGARSPLRGLISPTVTAGTLGGGGG